ncbi:MAG: class I SAM-dependent methyltransferase [Anaerolineae bacterium]|nr:class I SAM-dependent methyltransferase [Anaerolineae bacterium]
MFTTLLNRNTHPTGWQKIPWNDLDFSRRMLAEHLNQSHDHASRRQSIIDQQVAWIERKVLNGQPAKILDLGCGPGFYTRRFSGHGHTCTGLDFSPASIDYAREQHPGGTYMLGDVTKVDFGSGYDLALMIFGEFNAFSPEDAGRIVDKAYAALKPGGKLLLEAHTGEFIYRLGHQPPTWYTAEKGLFSDEPYLCLTEARYEADHAIAYDYVFAADSGKMQSYVNMLQGYTDDEYRRLLRGFQNVLFYPSLNGSPERSDLFVIVAEK